MSLLPPVRFEMSRVVPGRADLVWDLVTDWERQDDWMLEMSDLRVLTAQREGPGVEAEATITIGGIRTRDRVRVIAWEPERRLAIQHLGWVPGIGQIVLTPLVEGGTHVYWTEELHPPLGVLGAVGIRLLAPVMHRVFKRDLRILESLVRARAG